MPENNIQPSPFLHDEVNEVLGKTPIGLVRWGNLMLLIIVMALLGVSCLVYYPDVITGEATIVPGSSSLINSPAYETSIEKIFIKEGDKISKGQIVCLLKPVNAATHLDTIVASQNGIARLQRLINVKNTLPANSSLMIISNEQLGHYVVIKAPAHKAGKIVLGQQVSISPSQYPRQEYGELEGEIISKPSQEENGMVTIEAIITNNTTTTYGYKLPIYTTASGLATITVSRKSVFSRLFPFL
jgi:hypothetical protein